MLTVPISDDRAIVRDRPQVSVREVKWAVSVPPLSGRRSGSESGFSSKTGLVFARNLVLANREKVLWQILLRLKRFGVSL